MSDTCVTDAETSERAWVREQFDECGRILNAGRRFEDKDIPVVGTLQDRLKVVVAALNRYRDREFKTITRLSNLGCRLGNTLDQKMDDIERIVGNYREGFDILSERIRQLKHVEQALEKVCDDLQIMIAGNITQAVTNVVQRVTQIEQQLSKARDRREYYKAQVEELLRQHTRAGLCPGQLVRVLRNTRSAWAGDVGYILSITQGDHGYPWATVRFQHTYSELDVSLHDLEVVDPEPVAATPAFD